MRARPADVSLLRISPDDMTPSGHLILAYQFPKQEGLDMATFILVADSARARLFLMEKDHSLQEAETFVCPDDRLHEQGLTSDRRGRSFDSRGGGSHEMEPGTSQREQTAIGFAAELADRLENLRTAGEMDKLVLIAAPRFLGHLRSKVSDPVRSLVALSVDKDLTQQTPAQIAEHIPRFT
jgi:protein required for attachment to host cells